MIRRTLLLSSLWIFIGCNLALAQEPAGRTSTTAPGLRLSATPSEVSPSVHPEVWLYLHEMRRYEDPAQAVRRNAEQRAAERRERIAARRWMGFSPQRPVVFQTPITNMWGPMWLSWYNDGTAWRYLPWVDIHSNTEVRVSQQPTARY